jgi:hypothetical protein
MIGGVLIAAMLLMGAGFPTKKATPEHFANGVCTTVSQWSNATSLGEQQLNAALTAPNVQLSDLRDYFAGYLADTAHLTTLALDGLADAGTPSTPKGTQAAKVLTASFRKIRTSLRKLSEQAEEMSITDQAQAVTDVKAVTKQIGVEFASFNKALKKLKTLDPNHKLQKAFRANPTCQSL